LSELLHDIAADPTRERISIADLLSAMGDRAFGALMVIFAIPNMIPTPPGTSTVLGIPLVLLATQLMLGQKPWLPKLIGMRSIARPEFAALVARAMPWLAKAERFLLPRLVPLVDAPAEYAIGAICLLLAVILVLPIPLGNIPPALAICLFSFGVLERDGVWIVAGLAATTASLALVGAVAYALIKSVIFLLTTSAFS
jgi:hypothetical protein